jgi:hypothetical protein
MVIVIAVRLRKGNYQLPITESFIQGDSVSEVNFYRFLSLTANLEPGDRLYYIWKYINLFAKRSSLTAADRVSF